MSEDERGRPVLRRLGYLAFWIASFVVGAYLTFPYERVVNLVNQQLSESVRSMRVEIGSLSPSGLNGVNLGNVRISSPGPDASDKVTVVDSATVSLGLGSLLSLASDEKSESFSGSLDAQLAGGSIEGQVDQDTEQQHLEGLIEGLLLQRLTALETFIGLPLRGQLDGEVDVHLQSEPKKSEGALELRIDKLRIGDGKAKLPIPGMASGLTVDPLDAGLLELELDIEKGVATVRKLSANGPDLELEGSGAITLGKALARSRLDLKIRVRITKAYLAKSPRTEAALAMAGSNRRFKAAQAGDGWFQLRLGGTISRPRFNPAGKKGAAGRRASRKKNSSKKAKRSRGKPPPRPARGDNEGGDADDD